MSSQTDLVFSPTPHGKKENVAVLCKVEGEEGVHASAQVYDDYFRNLWLSLFHIFETSALCKGYSN